ncbi:MAG: pilus assembly protein TadG-related protein [Roseinatronobacter sp.]
MKSLSGPRPSFWRDEDGALLILGIFFFVAMLFTASLAIDIARYEQQRVQLQGIADRAVLAAANMRRDGDGDMNPTDHVRGYFLAEGFTSAQIDRMNIQVDPIAGGRRVTVQPQGTISTMLMSLIDINTLGVATPARAEISAPLPVEVVMVLDISWSMTAMTGNGQTRIENLRSAAAEMVRDLMQDREEGDVAITIVPYESWVVPPPGLLDYMENVSGAMSNANGTPQYCVEFQDWSELSDFRGNPTADALDGRNPAAANAVRNNRQAALSRRICGPLFGHRVTRPLVTSEDAAVAIIESLQPMGSTSIDLGLRFGAMFMDADMRPFIAERIVAGEISPSMANRPAGIDTPDVLRVMVVMTDGENCCGARFQPSVQDENALSVCHNLRAEGVLIYGIAFEAPEKGVELMSNCASSQSHFFNTNGAGLRATFEAIGRQINARSLRLTL